MHALRLHFKSNLILWTHLILCCDTFRKSGHELYRCYCSCTYSNWYFRCWHTCLFLFWSLIPSLSLTFYLILLFLTHLYYFISLFSLAFSLWFSLFPFLSPRLPLSLSLLPSVSVSLSRQTLDLICVTWCSLFLCQLQCDERCVCDPSPHHHELFIQMRLPRQRCQTSPLIPEREKGYFMQ